MQFWKVFDNSLLSKVIVPLIGRKKESAYDPKQTLFSIVTFDTKSTISIKFKHERSFQDVLLVSEWYIARFTQYVERRGFV